MSDEKYDATEDNAALAEAACVALGLPFGFTTPDMIRKAVESVRDMADQSGHRRGYALGLEHGKREEQREQRRARYVLGGLTPEQHDAAREQHTGEPPRAVEAISDRQARAELCKVRARLNALEARPDRIDAALVDIRERLEGFGTRQEELRRGQSALRQRVADGEAWRENLSNALDLLAIAGKG